MWVNPQNKMLDNFFKKSNFQKTNFLTDHFVSLAKLVTFVRGWDAQSRISRDKKIVKIPTKSSIWTLLVAIPIWKWSEDPPDLRIFRKFTCAWGPLSPSSRRVRSSDYVRSKALNVISKKNKCLWKNIFSEKSYGPISSIRKNFFSKTIKILYNL